VTSCLEVKRIYDLCQYIFSGEGEYVLDIHYVFSQNLNRYHQKRQTLLYIVDFPEVW
jgi:hypothetical protein